MSNSIKKQRLEYQIERRLVILKEWLANGIPAGFTAPKSLNQARVWSITEFDIEPIGSPASFTTSHDRHGKSVSRMQQLIEKLNSPSRTQKIKKPNNQNKLIRELRNKLDAQADSLTHSANQYTAVVASLDDYQRLYRIAAQSQKDAQTELEDANKIIRQLKSELVKARANKGNKVSSIKFKDEHI